MALLELRDLAVTYRTEDGQVPAVAAEPTTMPRCPTGSETS